MSDKKEIIKILNQAKIFVNQDILNKIKEIPEEKIQEVIKKLQANPESINENDFFKNSNITQIKDDANFEIITPFQDSTDKKEVDSFVQYFRRRYESISSILKARNGLNRTLSISRVLAKKESESCAIIGIVSEIRETKKGNKMLVLEDPTGKINVVITQRNKEMYEEAKDIVLDEIIGVVGNNDGKFIFANQVLWPDIPLDKELKKYPEEAYGVFISDLHVGSGYFLHEQFQKFIQWLNGEIGNEQQKSVVKKIKFLFIAGDIVCGVGIYPNQENDSEIKDIYKQYEKTVELLQKIPKNIKIIICAGNHDAVRLSEPQPKLPKSLVPGLYDLSNVTLVHNPCTIRILKNEKFPGFDVLMYHGYSFDYYVQTVESIRNKGGYHRADLIMQFLLKRRHLGPAHTSTLYMPLTTDDPLVIKHVPDFFITGHIHCSNVANYKNITMISGSCWEGVTDFQIKVGHEPDPAHVALVNFQTRDVKVLKF